MKTYLMYHSTNGGVSVNEFAASEQSPIEVYLNLLDQHGEDYDDTSAYVLVVYDDGTIFAEPIYIEEKEVTD